MGKGLIKKKRYELQFRSTECRNCGHILDVNDRFCSNCGQANSTKKLVLRDFMDEFLSNFLNYDSKLLLTLYTMLVRPGTITRNYINGKRVSYTNPFRFLLSLAFLYFLMVTYDSQLSDLDDLRLEDKIERTGPLSFSFETDTEENDSIARAEKIKTAKAQIDSLENLKKIKIPGIQNIDTLQTIIQDGMDAQVRKDSFMLANPKGFLAQLQNDGASLGERAEFFFTYLQKDSIKTFEDAKKKYGAIETWRNKLAFNGSKSTLKAIAQPGTYLNNTIAKLPLVIFFFLPVFTVFIFLVYIRKSYTYTDHLIFSFHNQSLLFILLVLSWIIDALFKTATAWIAFAVFSVYLFQAMRKFYGQGIFKTIIKYLFLNSVFLFLALICVVMLFTGSVFTY